MIDFTQNFINGNWNPVSFNPRPFVYGPVLMIIVAIIGKAIILCNSFLHINLPDQYNILFLGRLIVAIMGSLTSILVFKFCKLFCNTLVSFFAGVSLALSPLFLIHSSYFTVDAPLTLFTLSVIYYCQKLISNPKRIYYILIAVLSSLAFSTKFTSAILIFTILASHLIAHSKGKKILKILIHPDFVLFSFLFLIFTFVFINYMFYPIHNLHSFLQQLKVNALIARSRDIGCIYQNKCFFYSMTLFKAFKPFIAILFPLGLISFLYREKRFSIPVLSFFAVFFFVHCTVRNYSARYILPLIPIVAVIIAYSIEFFLDYCKGQRILYSFIFIIIAMQIFISSYQAIRIAYIMHLPETRILVINWINTFLPADAFITFEGKYPNLKRAYSQKFLDLFLKKDAVLHKKKNDFFVISSEANASFQEIMNCPERTEFYESIESNNILVKRFWYEITDFAQPEIKVIKSKFSDYPPFFEMFIQSKYDTSLSWLVFMNKFYSSSERGGVFLTKQRFNFLIVSADKLNSVNIYIENLKNKHSIIRLKSGFFEERMHLNPNDKKIISFKPHLSFPYFKYFYKVKIYISDEDKIYAKLITDPFNEALMRCSINDWRTALLKIQYANELEKDNPIILYFKSLFLYKNNEISSAMKMIKEIPSNMLQLYNSSFLPDKPFTFKKFSKSINNIPPGFYKLKLVINSNKDNLPLVIRISYSDNKIFKKYILQKGENTFLFSFKTECIEGMNIEIQNDSDDELRMDEIALNLDVATLLEEIVEHKLTFCCW
jgi:hypothetical protein